MSPELWRKYIKPPLAEMYALVKRHGKFISQHSCGNIIEIFPDLADIGLNMYQTFQPEIYDIKAVKSEYGDKLAFWGGISTQRLLPFETPERVVEATRETIAVMAENGGYIAAPTHSITGDVPPENIAALLNYLKKQV
jgi:uroporphyrinogen decarboxylase